MPKTIIVETWLNQKQETLTVTGLIEKLSQFDGSLPVVATWESVECPILETDINLHRLECGKNKPSVLYLDVGLSF